TTCVEPTGRRITMCATLSTRAMFGSFRLRQLREADLIFWWTVGRFPEPFLLARGCHTQSWTWSRHLNSFPRTTSPFCMPYRSGLWGQIRPAAKVQRFLWLRILAFLLRHYRTALPARTPFSCSRDAKLDLTLGGWALSASVTARPYRSCKVVIVFADHIISIRISPS